MDKAAINAQGFARAALAAKARGFRPDVVMAHAGWGAGMFARAVFPEAVSVPLVEWFYNTPAPDALALERLYPRPEPRPDQPMLQAGRNAPILMDLAMAQGAICPTPFQAAQFPAHLARFLTVLHDGVDTDQFAPDGRAGSDTLDGLVPVGAPIVTYATRGMEPHRGFPSFMRALPAVLEARPEAHAVILGENRVAYGDRALREVDWKARLLDEVSLPEGRVHFLGLLPRAAYRRILLRSSVHVYLTVPFVLSWSMLEAMSCGCLLVASDTTPVRDFAQDEVNALLVDHDDVSALAGRILAALGAGDRGHGLRATARQTIMEKAAAREVWPRKQALLEGLLGNCQL
jgi:glycosyltransferase involved in cell wall biosynthesis